jgi:hypothetical protein
VGDKAWGGAGLVLATAGAGVAWAFGWPGPALVWAALAVIPWTLSPPELTGAKTPEGAPTAANRRERAVLRRWEMWQGVKWRALGPNKWWKPALTVTSAAGVWCAALAGSGPLAPALPWQVRLCSAAAAYHAAVTGAGMLRDLSRGRSRPRPPVKLARLAKPAAGWPAVAVSAAAGAFTGAVWLPQPGWAPQTLTPWPALTGAVGGFAAFTVWGLAARRAAVKRHKPQWDGEDQWADIWIVRRQRPVPVFVERRVVEPNCLWDVLDVPAGAQTLLDHTRFGKEIAPLLAAGGSHAPVGLPNARPDGSPDFSRTHARQVAVAQWLDGSPPDVTAPGTGSETVVAAVSTALSAAAGTLRVVGVFAADAAALTAEPGPGGPDAATPAVWAVRLFPAGAADEDTLESLAAEASVALGVPVLSVPGDILVVGAVEPGMELEDPWGIVRAPYANATLGEYLSCQAETRRWNAAWTKTLSGRSELAPLAWMATLRESSLPGGGTVKRLTFILAQATAAQEMCGLSKKLVTALETPVAQIVGVPARQAPSQFASNQIDVIWSDRPPPASLSLLRPAGPDKPGPAWLVEAMLAQACDTAKLARPVLVRIEPLTRATPAGAGQPSPAIWSAACRLAGDDFAAWRKNQGKLATALRADWLRLHETAPGLVEAYFGARPDQVSFAARKATDPPWAAVCLDLDWEQAWYHAGVLSRSGQAPATLSCEPSPDNPAVTHGVFRLPAGVGYGAVQKNADRLKAALAAAFCVTQPGDAGDLVEVWSSQTDPMPAVAGLDYDEFTRRPDHEMPLGAGVDGSPVAADLRTNPHLLVCGVTGAGKSSTLQALVVGALLKGWPVAVLDPAEAKQGADYSFAEPFLRGLARDLGQAEALIGTVAAEVRRRGKLNSVNGVSHVEDLPERVRPPRVMVLVDEFVSVILPAQVPKATGNPLADQRREAVLAANERRLRIGEVCGQIAREGRATGVTLVISALKLLKSSLEAIPGGSSFREQLGRVFLGTGNHADWQVALNNPDNMPDMGEAVPAGRGVFEPVGKTRPQMCQFMFEPGGQPAMGRELAARLAPVPQADRWDRPGPAGAGGTQGAGQIDLGASDLDLDLDLGLDLGHGSPAGGRPGPDPAAGGGPPGVPAAWFLGAPAEPGGAALAQSDLPGADGQDTGWPLLESVARWLDRNPGTARLVWADQRFAQTDPLTGVPWTEIAEDHLAGRAAAVETRPPAAL